MATLGTTTPTLRDIHAGLVSKASADRNIVELFMQENPITDDIPMIVANDGTNNITTLRAALPTATFTAIYGGPTASKSQKNQVKDSCGMCESAMEVPVKLYDIAPDKEFFMLDEARTHVEAVGQQMADCMIYGNVATDPKKFNGLTIRYPAFYKHGTSGEKDPDYYVLNGSRSAQNTTTNLRSIWLVGFSSKSVHAFYPNGTNGGIVQQPVVQYRKDTDDGIYDVKSQLFQWQCGLSVKDFRYAGRICNIESDAMFNSTGMPDYLELLRRLVTRVRSNGVKQVVYMDKMVLEALQVLCERKTQANAIRVEDLFSRKVTTILGIPIRTLDCMASNEDAVAQRA
jgi:hypothetical protein